MSYPRGTMLHNCPLEGIRKAMRIIFDTDFDTGAWPGPLKDSDASIGELWAGKRQFLNALETALGLSGHFASEMERALGLVGALAENEGFWSKSAEVDPIGSARRVLQMRDDLWMWGWRGQGRRRLTQLAQVCAGVRAGMAAQPATHSPPVGREPGSRGTGDV